MERTPNPNVGPGADARFVQTHGKLARSLRKYNLASLVSSIGGLITMPDFQASAVRLEVLQHLAVANASGRLPPLACSLTRWLNELGDGWAGVLEDPAEDVFVSRVFDRTRNYLMFEGLYETSAFYLQRFVNVLDSMPAYEPFSDLKRAAHALLRLSDETVKRSGLNPYIVGNTVPLSAVTKSLARRGRTARSRVVFTDNDLTRLNIDRDDIEDFVLGEQDRAQLDGAAYGHSSLERHPLMAIGGNVYLTLPAAVSMAIRRMVIEWCLSSGCEDVLSRAYAREIADAFNNVPILGDKTAPAPPFQRVGGVFNANMTTWIDEGRLLHLCFLVDNFTGYDATGTVGLNPDTTSINKVIADSIAKERESFYYKKRFRGALSLIVLCGWGRSMTIDLAHVKNERWRAEVISAPDLISLSFAQSFSPLRLWSLLDSRDRLRQHGVDLVNANGLLNLHAWSESLDGHLVPHGDLPDDIINKSLKFIINQNSLLEVRKTGAQKGDVHRAITWDQQNVMVRRFGTSSYFREDANSPLYVSLDHIEQKRLVGVYETDLRGWWVMIEAPNCEDHDIQFRLWEMLATWIERSACALEATTLAMPEGPIAWICRFEDSHPTAPDIPIPSREEANRLLEVNTSDNVVRVTARKGFLTASRVAENIGERLLVERFVAGSCRLSSKNPSTEMVNSLVDQIVPNKWARSMHFLPAKEYRDFIGINAREKPILISKVDDALSRIGLGWRIRRPEQGNRIEGIGPCCKYLNELVETIWTEIRSRLKTYNRRQLLVTLYRYHEIVQIESDRWFRTARAVLSLHRDQNAAAEESANEIAKLNASSLCTRILIEMALCECPANGGKLAGRLDISRLFTEVMHMYYFGGWSGAIWYECKEPVIRITPLGDVHTNVDFDQQIFDPYVQSHGVGRYRYGASAYERHFRHVEPLDTAREKFEPAFWQAWSEAFGFSIDDVRVFMDNLDHEGLKRQELVFSATEAEIAGLTGSNRLDPVIVRKILETFALVPRSTWASTPEGFSSKDWYPWRSRRRLSLISRPILRLEEKTPRYLIAPGMVRDGIRTVMVHCFDGGYEARAFPIGLMRSWIGTAENKRGHAFNKEVAAHLESLGWNAWSDIKMTRILNAKLDRDYGDVDVLAWKAGRVVAIECKDLELAVTPTGIARQLYDFRGKSNHYGKPDRLRKHITRLELLNLHKAAVGRFVAGHESRLVEGLIVFSKVVPMHFAGFPAKHEMRVVTKEDLANI